MRCDCKDWKKHDKILKDTFMRICPFCYKKLLEDEEMK
jgi:hypothetical protein